MALIGMNNSHDAEWIEAAAPVVSRLQATALLLALCVVLGTGSSGCGNKTEPGAPQASDVQQSAQQVPAPPQDQPVTDQAGTNQYQPPTGIPDEAPPADRVFTREQLEQMVAPIALHPDPLLTQILMAATYPAEVVDADAWLRDRRDLKGDQLDAAVREQNWEESVQSLTHFPQVLELMAADRDWMRDLGDAFLAQKDDVLNAVQEMRLRACDLGHLKTTAQQRVVVEQAPPPQSAQGRQTAGIFPPPPRIVRIMPAEPGVVYVPAYSPQIVYGPTWPVLYYPRVIQYRAPYLRADSIIAFGVGLAVGAALWGDVDWHDHHVYRGHYEYRGHDYYDDVSQRELWRHDGWHRRGVDYRSNFLTREYGRGGEDYGRHGEAYGRHDEHRGPPPNEKWMEKHDERARSAPNEKWLDKHAGPPPQQRPGDHAVRPPRQMNQPGQRSGPPAHGREFDQRTGRPHSERSGGGPAPKDMERGNAGAHGKEARGGGRNIERGGGGERGGRNIERGGGGERGGRNIERGGGGERGGRSPRESKQGGSPHGKGNRD